MTSVYGYSATAASNNSAAPDGAPENMAPSGVNDTIRKLMANIAEFVIAPTAGGTADALTVTPTNAVAAVVNGMIMFVRAAAANATTTPTFAPSGLTARTITKQGGAALVVGDIAGAGHVLILQYKSADTTWDLLNPAVPSVVAASEGTAGKAELATQSEVNTGTDDARIVTPLKLTSWTPAVETVSIATDDKVLIADTSASGVLKQALVSDIASAIPASKITAGSTLTKNPLAADSLTTQAHGLGTTPTFVNAYIECISADIGYAVGDRVYLGSVRQESVTDGGIHVISDSDEMHLLIGLAFGLVGKSSFNSALIDFTKWKGIVIPYLVS